MATSQAEGARTEARNCARHGAYMATHLIGTIWRGCEACQAEQEAARAAAARLAEEALDHERAEHRLGLSGLVGRFRRASFDNFSATTAAQHNALQACQAMTQKVQGHSAGNLILSGPPGTGKTHLGAAMVNEVIRTHKRWAAIHSARDIVRMIRNTWARNEPLTESELIEHLCSVDLLVIDEVGVGFGTDAELIHIFDIVDGRYQRELPIVLCTNLPLAGLRQALGDRAFDRIREGAKVVPCDWVSYRGNRKHEE